MRNATFCWSNSENISAWFFLCSFALRNDLKIRTSQNFSVQVFAIPMKVLFNVMQHKSSVSARTFWKFIEFG